MSVPSTTIANLAEYTTNSHMGGGDDKENQMRQPTTDDVLKDMTNTTTKVQAREKQANITLSPLQSEGT